MVRKFLVAFAQLRLDLLAPGDVLPELARQPDEADEHGGEDQERAVAGGRRRRQAGLGARRRIVEKAIDREVALEHAHVGIGIGDVPPAAGIHVADLDEVRPQQPLHFTRLVEQVVAAFALAVAGNDEVGDFLRMLHGIGPAQQAGVAKGLHPLGLLREQFRGGEQVVAVEVDAGGARGKFEIGELLLLEEVGLVGAVGGQHVGAAVDQVLMVEAVRLDLEQLLADAFLAQVGEDLVGMRLDHEALAGEVVHGADVGVAPGGEDEGRVLEDHGQRHHRFALGAGQEQRRIGDAELRAAVEDFLDRIGVRPGLADVDLQPRIAVVALFLRGVVAGELELVLPFQLQDDLLQRPRGERQQGDEEEEQAHRRPPVSGSVAP